MSRRSLFQKIASLATARHIEDRTGSAASVASTDSTADPRKGVDVDQPNMGRLPRPLIVAIVAVELLVAYLAFFEPARVNRASAVSAGTHCQPPIDARGQTQVAAGHSVCSSFCAGRVLTI